MDDPVRTLHPAPVIAPRGTLEPGLHGQEIAKGDLPHPRIGLVGNSCIQQRSDSLVRPFKDAAVDRDPDQRGNDRL